jgi:hypothetical protein
MAQPDPMIDFAELDAHNSKWRFRPRFWRADPVVDELKQLAGLILNV